MNNPETQNAITVCPKCLFFPPERPFHHSKIPGHLKDCLATYDQYGERYLCGALNVDGKCKHFSPAAVEERPRGWWRQLMRSVFS